MRRHVLVVYGRFDTGRFDTSLFQVSSFNFKFVSKSSSYRNDLYRNDFVSKWLCIEVTLYLNDRTPSLLFKKIPNSVT